MCNLLARELDAQRKRCIIGAQPRNKISQSQFTSCEASESSHRSLRAHVSLLESAGRVWMGDEFLRKATPTSKTGRTILA